MTKGNEARVKHSCVVGARGLIGAAARADFLIRAGFFVYWTVIVKVVEWAEPLVPVIVTV